MRMPAEAHREVRVPVFAQVEINGAKPLGTMYAWNISGGLNVSSVAVCFTPFIASVALSSTDFTVLPSTGGWATFA